MNHFGLDLSPSSIKIIQAETTSSGFHLNAFGETPIPASYLSDVERDQTLIAQTIKKLALDARVSSKNVVVALSESQVYSMVVELPPLSEAELENALKFEAEQYVPVPLDQVQIEHQVLKMPPKGAENAKMEVLLIAAQKGAIRRLEQIIDFAGLTPIALETGLLAVLRSVSFQLEGSGMIIDIGQNTTDLAFTLDGTLKQINTIGSGGDAFTRAIATSLALQPLQAEQYKRAYGMDASQLEGKVAAAIADPLNVILNQIQRSLDYVRQKFPASNPKKAVLTGGAALMPNLSLYLADKLGLEVLLGDPFAPFIREKSFPEPLIQVAPRFATAVGLALRES